MTNASPAICTDRLLAAEICSAVGYQRERALQKFVTGAYQHIFKAVRAYTKRKEWKNCSEEHITDACTDAYLAFCRNTAMPGFQFYKEDMCGYIFRISLRVIYRQFKRSEKQIESFDAVQHEQAETATPHTKLEDGEQYEKLQLLLQQLHPEEQEILACVAEQYKMAEIALHMQEHYARIAEATKKAKLKSAEKHLWTEPYTKVRVQRARQKLLDLLSNNF